MNRFLSGIGKKFVATALSKPVPSVHHKAGETIAVFYGAAHMPELAKRLRQELHYAPVAQEWDTAFTADPKKSALPPAQLKMMLDMVRAQMKQVQSSPAKTP